MYRYETHLHTCQGSACGVSTGAEHARFYKERGYQGIFVTDHFFGGNTAVRRDLPWKERIDWFCSGFEDAWNEGQKIGLDVFFGWEYNYNGADLLTYGLGLDFLLAHPDMTTWQAGRYFDEIHAAGGFIVHAHPFRQAGHVPCIQLFPDKTDAVEVYNGSHYAACYSPAFNDRALWYAQTYNKVQTAGSDTHGLSFGMPQRGGSMIFDRKVASIHEMIDLIRNNRFRIDVK